MPVRWLTNRARTRCSACRSSCSAVFVATNLIVGRCTASAIASASRKSFFCPFEYLLSRPPNWQTQQEHLQRTLQIGRKLLRRCRDELIDAGYIVCDATQGRDDLNRFTALNYIVRDIPTNPNPGDPEPQRPAPLPQRSD